MISVTCPTCGAALRARDDLRGHVVLCPKCDHATPVGFEFDPYVSRPIERNPQPERSMQRPDSNDVYRVQSVDIDPRPGVTGDPGDPNGDAAIEQTLKEAEEFLKQVRRRGRRAHLWPVADIDLPDWSWLYVWLGLTLLPTALYAIAIGWWEAIAYTMGNFIVGGIVTALFANRLHPVTWFVLAFWAFVLCLAYTGL